MPTMSAMTIAVAVTPDTTPDTSPDTWPADARFAAESLMPALARASPLPVTDGELNSVMRTLLLRAWTDKQSCSLRGRSGHRVNCDAHSGRLGFAAEKLRLPSKSDA